MTIALSCPRCGKQSGAPEECAGQVGQCPYCGNAIPIPARSAPPSATPVPSSPTGLKLVTWLVRFPNGQTWGPVNRKQLDEAVATGRLPAEACVFKGDSQTAIPLVELYPQLRESLAAAQAPFSGQVLTSAVRPRTLLENLIFGPEMPRYKADKRREIYEERQLIMLTYVGIWVLVWICGSILAGLQGGVEAGMGAALGFFFASLVPVGFGLVLLAAGLFEPEWLMNCWDGRRRRWLWGDTGARYTYMIPGFLLFIGGGMFACFMMAVGGIGGSTLALDEKEEETKVAEVDFDPPLPGYSAAGLTRPNPSAQANAMVADASISTTDATLADTASDSKQETDPDKSDPNFVDVSGNPANPADDKSQDVAYQVKTREEALRNSIAAYGQLRQQWDSAYNKSADLLKSTGGLASDSKGELRVADEQAMSIAKTLSVASDSIKAAHSALKTYCDEHKVFSDVLGGYVEPPAEVPGLKEIERRTQVAKLALASGEEFVFLDAVTKVEQFARQRRELARSLDTAVATSAELQKLDKDLQEARKWAYQARRTVEQKASRGQVSQLLEIYPPDREAVARYGTATEQRAIGMNPTHASRFAEASRMWLMAGGEVERARDRAAKAEQAMAAYQARFGRAPSTSDAVGQNYTGALKAYAAAEKKLDDARVKLEEAATQLGLTSSLLQPAQF